MSLFLLPRLPGVNLAQPAIGFARSLGMRTVAAALVAACLLAGCSATPIPHALTLDDERARCLREGRWWKAHDVPPRCEMRIGD